MLVKARKLKPEVETFINEENKLEFITEKNGVILII
jgi:hypothetical protein